MIGDSSLSFRMTLHDKNLRLFTSVSDSRIFKYAILCIFLHRYCINIHI